jgi:hypothetical protein
MSGKTEGKIKIKKLIFSFKNYLYKILINEDSMHASFGKGEGEVGSIS